jgi:hypothetical protein
MDLLSGAIGWTSLVAGAACLVLSVVAFFQTKDERKSARDALKTAAEQAKGASQDAGKFGEQAGALSTGLGAVADLAKALKDLDRVGQLLVLALGFLAVGGVVAGLEEVATAIAE